MRTPLLFFAAHRAAGRRITANRAIPLPAKLREGDALRPSPSITAADEVAQCFGVTPTVVRQIKPRVSGPADAARE